jgi:hypothetical protein
MTYKSAQVYTGSEWVNLAVSVPEATQRTVGNITGTSYTILETDAGKVLVFSNSSAVTLTVPDDSTYNFPIGQVITLVQKETGTVSVEGESSAQIRCFSEASTLGQYSRVELLKIAANEWLLSGDLS